MLFAASLAAWVAYLAGGTWYDYHRYPFRVFALVAFGSLLLTRLPRLAAVGVGGLVAFSLVVALSFATLRASGSPRASGRPLGAGAEIARAVARHGSRVIWLPASSVDPAFPAVNHAGVEWASRFSCLWPLPAVILAQVRPEAGAGAERGARLDRIRRWVMTAIVEDLERMPPDLIFVPHEPDNLAFRGYGFDFRTLFSRDPRLAEIWSRYVWVESTPSLDVYARRQPRSG
jgi:hypothetical protein